MCADIGYDRKCTRHALPWVAMLRVGIDVTGDGGDGSGNGNGVPSLCDAPRSELRKGIDFETGETACYHR